MVGERQRAFEPIPLFLVMPQGKDNVGISPAKPAWSVVVVYEDVAARERAVNFCDLLVKRFWARFEFNLSWWSLEELHGGYSAQEAARKAVDADLIVAATKPDEGMPRPLRDWMEGWLGRRRSHEGSLVGLGELKAGVSGVSAEKYVYLRNAAHRGGMDYLTEIPQSISSRSIPDSLDSYNQRADKVTSVMDGILHRKTPPPHV
jgi:hypothetical protein